MISMKSTILVMLMLLLLEYGCSQGAPTDEATTQAATAPQQQGVPEPSAPAAAAAPITEPAKQTEKTIATGTSSPQEANIDLKDFAFSPDSVTVKKGTKVTWTQRDSAGHTVTSYEGIFDSPILAKGETWSYTFDNVGAYKYYCAPHPRMEGTIIVE